MKRYTFSVFHISEKSLLNIVHAMDNSSLQALVIVIISYYDVESLETLWNAYELDYVFLIL